jgi:hypothetical protein
VNAQTQTAVPAVPAAREAAGSRDDPAHPEFAYRERARLVACLAAACEAHWAQPDPADPHAAAYRVVCLHTRAGQLTWHVHPDDEALFPALPVRPSDFDGHTTRDKHARLAALARATASGSRPGTAPASAAGVRARVLAVLLACRDLPAVLTPEQVRELADALVRAVGGPGDAALRAELAASAGSGWAGRGSTDGPRRKGDMTSSHMPWNTRPGDGEPAPGNTPDDAGGAR